MNITCPPWNRSRPERLPEEEEGAQYRIGDGRV
jgi:hypothetical protein